MNDTKLTDFDRSILARLRGRRLTITELIGRLSAGTDRETVSRRLALLADNDLVRELDDGGGSDDGDDSGGNSDDVDDENARYALTESGRRVLQSPNTAAADEAVDLPPNVREALSQASVGVDCTETLKHAFTFLREWGEVTIPELKAGVFPETTTGYRDADEWWDDCARDVFAELPRVDPGNESDPFWRYVGDSAADGTAEDEPRRDGRAVLRSRDDGPQYANLTHVLVSRKVTREERVAAAAAFDALRRRGEATTDELRAAASSGTTRGRPSETWIRDDLFGLLVDVPSVERLDADRWRLRTDES
ncbi:hypothetical protein AUR64_06850 [Haloprofundus marisrubri]|uniref:Uncharacterized protein n=1 Tax=Haloprofundus marisrubri TaxID=1514971 RepID=A0A0W1RB39_9EURY|nr:hypothetical protein [Haloprofundus marisrubri]KTG10894.1 hypothetical protein AUR64_06850 [Haloprofundus marisrubri]